MKKLFIIGALSLLGFSAAHSSSVLVEGKFSYFRPDSDTFRKIIPGWIPKYEIEASGEVWRGFHVWGSVGYMTKGGHALGTHQSTHIQIVPITLGLEYVYAFNEIIEAYLGLGPRYLYVNIHNNSSHVRRVDSKNGVGGAFRLGGLINITKHWVFDFFGDYTLKTMHFSGSNSRVQRHDLHLSGLSLGFGAGYRF